MLIIEKLEELDKDEIEELRLVAEQFIKENLIENLDLQRLDCIYVPNDFDQAILNFQIENGLVERGSTNNELGTAFGKTIDYKLNGTIKDRIFIRKEIFIALFIEDSKTLQLAINTIHHELCHVHDNLIFENMIEFQESINSEERGLSSTLTTHAIIIFGEYIVPKMAVRTQDMNKIVELDILKTIIEKAKQIIDEQIQKYKSGDISIDEVFQSVQITGGTLMKHFSKMLGEIDGLLEDSIELENSLNEFMNQFYIGGVWNDFVIALRSIDSTYPNWKSLNEIEPFKKAILNIWNSLGVFPSQREKGIWVSV